MADVTVDIALEANVWTEISAAQSLANNARIRIDFDGNSTGKVAIRGNRRFGGCACQCSRASYRQAGRWSEHARIHLPPA